MKDGIVDLGSFRDPSGFIFTRLGRLFRQVNQSCKNDYDLLLSSGLYESLVRDRLLVSHVVRPRTAAAARPATKSSSRNASRSSPTHTNGASASCRMQRC
jgi:hypothetical protein